MSQRAFFISIGAREQSSRFLFASDSSRFYFLCGRDAREPFIRTSSTTKRIFVVLVVFEKAGAALPHSERKLFYYLGANGSESDELGSESPSSIRGIFRAFSIGSSIRGSGPNGLFPGVPFLSMQYKK